MNIREKWIPWNPENKLSGYYEKVCFLDSDTEGTIITFIDETNKKKMKIIFKGGGLAGYRYTDETYMSDVQQACASEGSLAYKVSNSQYIKWLSEVSNTVSDFMLPNLQHFVFVSSEAYLEILYASDPKVKIIDLP